MKNNNNSIIITPKTLDRPTNTKLSPLKLRGTNAMRPCPICGDRTGKCRIKNHGELILCASNKDGRTSPNNDLYKWAKFSKHKRWGVFFLNTMKKLWRKFRSFTAQQIINERFFDADLPEDNTIFGVLSGMGTGKTHWLVSITERLNQAGVGIVALGYRNSLLLQMAELLNLHHLHEHNGFMLLQDSAAKIGLCMDSLGHLPPGFFEDKVIFLDESISSIRHLLNSKTIKDGGQRERLLNIFEQAVREARFVVCLDGALSDWNINYLKELAPDKKVVTIENTYKGLKANCTFFKGSYSPLDDILRSRDWNAVKKMMVDFAERGEPIAIATDSQKTAQTLDNLLINQGIPGGWRLDSTTTCQKATKKVIENIDKAILEQQPTYIIYTSSTESGIDISVKEYFKCHFAIFFGVLCIDSMLQMLGRVRDPDCPKMIWCPEFANFATETASYGWDPLTAYQAMNDVCMHNLSDLMSGHSLKEKMLSAIELAWKNSDNVHCKTALQVQAMSRYEKQNLRSCLIEAINKAGYPLSIVTGEQDKPMAELYKTSSEEVKVEWSTDIFNADVEKLLQSGDVPTTLDASYEQQVARIKLLLLKQLPGIEESIVWSVDFVKHIMFDNRQAIKQAQKRFLLRNPEAAKHLDLKKYTRTIESYRNNGHAAVWNLNDVQYSKLLKLIEMGLPDMLAERGTRYTKESPTIVDFYNEGLKDYEGLNIIGINPAKDPVRYVGRVLNQFGLKLLNKQIRKDNERTREYWIDSKPFADPFSLAIDKCVATLWNPLVEKDLAIEIDLEFPTNEPQETINSKPEDVTPNPNNVYTPNGSAVTDNQSTIHSRDINPQVDGKVGSTSEELSPQAIGVLLEEVQTQSEFFATADCLEIDRVVLQEVIPHLSKSAVRRVAFWAGNYFNRSA